MDLHNALFRRLFHYFVRGLILVAPTYLTITIITYAVGTMDSILPIYIPTSGNQQTYMPGLGILIILCGIIFLGFLFSTIIPQSFFRFTESLLRKIPLVSLIYYSIKDLITAFVGDKKKFDHPVLVTVYKDTDIKKMGFITQTDLSNLGILDHIAVYVPHSYAFSGELFLVPVSHITALNASSTEVMKMIVSGGVSAGEARAAEAR